jgi:hypothetical protein
VPDSDSNHIAGYCRSCGRARHGAERFCGGCGLEFHQATSPAPSGTEIPASASIADAPVPVEPAATTQTINALGVTAKPQVGGWLVPIILFGWVAGLVGWIANRDSDPRRANHVLKWGVLSSVIHVAATVAVLVVVLGIAGSQSGAGAGSSSALGASASDPGGYSSGAGAASTSTSPTDNSTPASSVQTTPVTPAPTSASQAPTGIADAIRTHWQLRLAGDAASLAQAYSYYTGALANRAGTEANWSAALQADGLQSVTIHSIHVTSASASTGRATAAIQTVSAGNGCKEWVFHYWLVQGSGQWLMDQETVGGPATC